MKSWQRRFKDWKMRGGQMSSINDYGAFTCCMSTLKKTSLDDGSGKNQYMTESQMSVVDFDKVKDNYARLNNITPTPKSNDALFNAREDDYIFVEFKNGKISQKKKYEIWEKIYNSVMIFGDITETTLSYMRENLKYILVYNETVQNGISAMESGTEKANEVASSAALDDIAKRVTGYGGKEFVKFGLDKFKGYCFKEVHTYNQNEFEDYLKNM